ncbi:putative helicase ATP-binding domain-containing protein [Xylophilus phage Lumi]|nr:putative helicase ATP-binding domain-containing protein [Xylophilus phage Lumi]
MTLDFTLRPFQIEDIARKINDPFLALFHDAGTGKTPIAAVLSHYYAETFGDVVVWTCPSGIMLKNKMDLIRFGGFKEEEIIILQGATPLKRKEMMEDKLGKVYLMSAQGFAAEWEMLNTIKGGRVRSLFHDEMHLYYAGHEAKRTEAWYKAVKKMRSVTCMTGSWIKGRLDSTYPTLHALHPLYYGNHKAFMTHHAMYDHQGRIMGWRDKERLTQIMGQVGIRRSFREVYGEEKKVILPEPVRMSKNHQKFYNTMSNKGILELEDSFLKGETGGTKAIRLRQILAHPEFFGLDIKGPTARDEALEAHIENAIFSGERLAIFSALVPEMDRVYKTLKAKGLKVGLINGSVSGPERQQIDQDFNSGKLQFVVASAATAGVGLNWHFLEDMIFLSMDYEDSSFMQAYRRGIRGTRETPLRIHVIYYKSSVEEDVIEKIEWKSRETNGVDETAQVLEISKKVVVLPDSKSGKLTMGSFM